MPDYFDLPSDVQNYFPLHGWIEGINGVRHLRLPILRTFQSDHPAYPRYAANGLSHQWLQFRSPAKTLRQIAVALRDLHEELRHLMQLANEEWLDKEPSEARDRAITRQNEGVERCEVLLISSFSLLRRLADDLMKVLTPLLFKSLKSTPKKLNDLITLATSNKLKALNPYYEVEALSTLLITKSAWLQKLRDRDGVRDTLMHEAHILQVGALGTKPVNSEKFFWHITASLTTSARGKITSKDLLPILLDCLAGACEFMTGITQIIGVQENFDRRDIIFLTGLDNDIVGFWPAIRGGKQDFPMRA